MRRCDNPSKWGLQQRAAISRVVLSSCDNPSKWGLQQLIKSSLLRISVVITPQNGVFNNACVFTDGDMKL